MWNQVLCCSRVWSSVYKSKRSNSTLVATPCVTSCWTNEKLQHIRNDALNFEFFKSTSYLNFQLPHSIQSSLLDNICFYTIKSQIKSYFNISKHKTLRDTIYKRTKFLNQQLEISIKMGHNGMSKKSPMESARSPSYESVWGHSTLLSQQESNVGSSKNQSYESVWAHSTVLGQQESNVGSRSYGHQTVFHSSNTDRTFPNTVEPRKNSLSSSQNQSLEKVWGHSTFLGQDKAKVESKSNSKSEPFSSQSFDDVWAPVFRWKQHNPI